MTLLGWVAVLLVGVGCALVGVGLVARKQQRDRQMAAILGRSDPRRGRSADDEELPELVESTIGFAGRLVEQVDTRGGLLRALDNARIPLRAGEFVTIVACFTLFAATVGALLTHAWIVPVLVVIGAPLLVRSFLLYRARARINAFAAQLPDTLTVLAASLDAGHTFLRSIQMICEETDPPISDEFGRVISETQLGLPLIDALERMSQRVPLRDIEWVVQAIRIQQTVGGRLAELLGTLADFIRAREEVRREVAALTAEGRISAWVVGAIPVVLFFVAELLQPDYMKPMLQGWGVVWLAGTAISVVTGMLIIRRMVNQVEV